MQILYDNSKRIGSIENLLFLLIAKEGKKYLQIRNTYQKNGTYHYSSSSVNIPLEMAVQCPNCKKAFSISIIDQIIGILNKAKETEFPISDIMNAVWWEQNFKMKGRKKI